MYSLYVRFSSSLAQRSRSRSDDHGNHINSTEPELLKASGPKLIQITCSLVVLQCYRRQAIPMKQTKIIRPSVTLYSLDRSLPNLVWLIASATLIFIPILVKFGEWEFPANRWDITSLWSKLSRSWSLAMDHSIWIILDRFRTHRINSAADPPDRCNW